ncbi:V-type ATP synthase subunit E [Candidatus Bariatricus faecipullorum]
MEIQLQELIDQIKKDGVETAEAQAESILNSAKAEAEEIVARAQAQADKILLDAKNENDRIVKSGEEAIRQAGRNLLISFRDSVSRELSAIVRENVSDVYSSDALSKIIVSAVESWAAKPDADDLSVILNSNELEALEKNAIAELNEKMRKGVTLKASDSFDGGFRIAEKDGQVYYDYSTEAVVEMLSNYLNPKVTEIMKEA